MAHDILIVDDEEDIRTLVSGILEDEGLQTRVAANSEEAFFAISTRLPTLVILDVWLRNSAMDGLEVLSRLREEHPDLPVVMISGHSTIEMAVAAIRQGAYDFIEKPFKADRLLLVVQRAGEAFRLKRENRVLRQRAGENDRLLGTSSAVNQVRQTATRVAGTNSRVFITGPPGVGKEVVARLVHGRSRRAKGPFVTINCAALQSDRVEEELFGTETANGSGQRKVGVFEEAHNGTLLLDEVADMPVETQAKIVRVLQEQTFTRIGGTRKVQVDVRVVATSNRNITAEIEAGRFRQNLFYRLNVVPITVPPLRERREDIPLLARFFMERAAENAGIAVRQLGDDALAALQACEWPGNVRQLRNVVDWLLIMANGPSSDPIRADMLPTEICNIAPDEMNCDFSSEIMSLPLREAREIFEREYLRTQVARFNANISRTASFIGMERSALHRKLKSLGIIVGDRNGERGLSLTTDADEAVDN